MVKSSIKKLLYKLPGKPLPKHLLRPFIYEEPVSIDDKQYVILGLGDRVGVVEFLMAFPYVIALGGGVGWLATGLREPIALIVAVIALVITLTMHYAGLRNLLI